MDTSNPWVKYSEGHWTREMPSEPGCYTVTSADPTLAGEETGLDLNQPFPLAPHPTLIIFKTSLTNKKSTGRVTS